MLIILKKISPRLYLLCVLAAAFASSALSQTFIPDSQSRLTIAVQKKSVLAHDVTVKSDYQFDSSAASLLRKADDIKSVAYAKFLTGDRFVILARVPSRPENRGMGYCGAGYEDYLLLVELRKRTLLLRDQFLLQSCLKERIIYGINGERDPIKLMSRKVDGSFSFRWESDGEDETRTLAVDRNRFLTTLSPSEENSPH
jgi:hypothetical protein